MLAKWLTKRVEFSVRGQKWPLIFTHRALFICQEQTGLDMLTTNLQEPSAVMVRSLLFAALKCCGAEVTVGQVGEEINRTGLAKSRDSLIEAWGASMAEPAAEESSPENTKPTWSDAWAIARQDLKLSDQEWLDMTPRMFAALQKTRFEQIQREELMAAKIESAVINYSMRAPKEWVSPGSLLIHKPKESRPSRLSGEYILSQFNYEN